ncbi:MAG TPA: sigma-70 family RNA polymerase sigma factor [bacterium]|nr:sigma-70 family RNA polymerase sigma factor [bacterium]
MTETNQYGEVSELAGLDERGLLTACWRRDAGAWERFLAQYSRLIYYSIHRTCLLRHYQAAPDEVADLFNDVLVHFIKDDCKKLMQFRGDAGCSVATWIRTVTVRFIIDYLRRGARGASFVDVDNEDVAREISFSNPVARPDEVYEEREDDRMFNLAVGSLPENDRYFIELYYTRGLSPEAVAQVLGISVKTVYSRINRVKTKIKEAMEADERK